MGEEIQQQEEEEGAGGGADYHAYNNENADADEDDFNGHEHASQVRYLPTIYTSVADPEYLSRIRIFPIPDPHQRI
jgi:hypothetical protein